MNRQFFIFVIVLTVLLSSCSNEKGNVNYYSNSDPANQNAYIKLPPGSVRPDGWLKAQLDAQAERPDHNEKTDERLKNDVLPVLEKIDNYIDLADQSLSEDNKLYGKYPEHDTVLTSIMEYIFSLAELYAINGDNKLADKLEILTFNTLPGTITSEAGAYYAWPKFVENMWMATNENGLALVAYGPSVVDGLVAKGRKVTITEETDYPFSGEVTLRITTEKTVRFPVEIRIPGWADSVKIRFKRKSVVVNGSERYIINERWKNGDQIFIELPMDLRTENGYNNSISLLRGALYFSLRIDKQFTNIINNDSLNNGRPGWEVTPKSDWNYGLLIDKNNIMRGLSLSVNEIGRYPFYDRGDMVWSSDSAKYISVEEDAPLVLTARGIRIPEWTMKNNSANTPPLSPVKPVGDPEIIKLVPYGCTRIRITEFPVMDIILMEDVFRPSSK